MDTSRRAKWRRTSWFTSTVVLAALIVLLAISLIATLGIGTVKYPFSLVYSIVADKLFSGGTGAGVTYTVAQGHVIWDVRLPRVILGVLCGAGLAVCGAVMQAIVQNPIADPYILGISSGSSAGAAIALLTPLPIIGGQFQTTTAAAIGALVSAAVVYMMAKAGGGGKLQPMTLLLSGTAVNAVMSAVTSFLIFLAKSPEGIAAVYNWQMGSLGSATATTLPLPLIGVTAGVIIFSIFGGRFNLLMMGDEYACALGMNVKVFRAAMFIVSSIVIATLVSITGIIGFVGLIIPHIVRLLTRTSNNAIVIPYSALIGAIYLLWADAGARSLFGAAELPLGIITAFIGAPFFLYLMVAKQAGGSRD